MNDENMELDRLGRLAVRVEKGAVKSMHARLDEDLAPLPVIEHVCLVCGGKPTVTFWLQGSADWLPAEVGRSFVTVAGTKTRALPFCGEEHCYDWLQEHEREIGRVGAPKLDWGATWVDPNGRGLAG